MSSYLKIFKFNINAYSTSQSNYNGDLYFDQFERQFGNNDNFEFTLLYSNQGDVKASELYNM